MKKMSNKKNEKSIKNSNNNIDRISRTLSIIALICSIVIPSLTFICGRMDMARRYAENIEVSASIDFRIFKITKEEHTCFLTPDSHEDFDLFSGLKLYLNVNIINKGERPLSISSIMSKHIINGAFATQSFSNTCLKNDLTSEEYFPVIIEPNTSYIGINESPFCINDIIKTDFNKFLLDSILFSKNVFNRSVSNRVWIGLNGSIDAFGAYFRHEIYNKVISSGTEYIIRVYVTTSSGRTYTCDIDIRSEFD